MPGRIWEHFLGRDRDCKRKHREHRHHDQHPHNHEHTPRKLKREHHK